MVLAGWAESPALAQQSHKTACSKIMDMCMKRAGDGHAGVCEDMYSQARNTGVWPATAEPDGTTPSRCRVRRDHGFRPSSPETPPPTPPFRPAGSLQRQRVRARRPW